ARDYGDDARDEIFKALRQELNHRPLWTIIRTGLTVRGHVSGQPNEKFLFTIRT
ncbi:MAG: hypothetical protein HKP13_05265, partial [Gammaproteobacteria bacterium]|nr:hypothetical protein [Gammaproteobacteria bacterium]